MKSSKVTDIHMNTETEKILTFGKLTPQTDWISVELMT